VLILEPVFSLLPNADDLNLWAQSLAAEFELGRLIQKLILQTASPAGLRIPVGKAGNTPGWDGVVNVAAGNFRVPTGQSFWEWGAGPAPDKAQRDYKKRTEATDEAVRKASTFVFVTPRHWDYAIWLEEKRASGDWAGVEVWNASDLESWLEKGPIARVWLAEVVNKAGLGEAQTLEAWWDDWCGDFWRFTGTTRLALGGREAQATVVRGWVEIPADYHAIQANATDEGIAFVSAALLSSDAHESAVQRAVVVHGPGAWNELAAIEDPPMILIPTFLGAAHAKALRRGHTVIEPVVPDQPGPVHLELPGAVDADLMAALNEMGVEFSRAEAAVRAAGGRLGPVRRRISDAPSIADWANAEEARFLVPALFAGRWDEDAPEDQLVLARLADMTYAELREGLVRLMHMGEAPVRLTNTKWSVRAPLDAWSQIVHLVHHEQWTAFIDVAVDVLGARDPALDLPPDERWLALVKGKGRPHSDELRRAIAQNLAIVGSQSEFGALPRGRSGAEVASVVVGQLLRDANGDPSGEKWATLEDELPWLAEAAPTTFLGGVSGGLEGKTPVLGQLFLEERSMMTPRTHLPGLLWALERLAWAPDYLSDVAVILTRLASIDPGITSGNNPSSSLAEIFKPWHPQTNADTDRKLAALDAARQADSATAWRVMRTLLPTNRGIAIPTSRPEWRTWAPASDITVTRGEYWAMVAAILGRLLADADADGTRWDALIEAFDDLSEELGDQILTGLDALDLERLTPEGTRALSTRIREVVAHHRTYATADWAMGAERVAKLEAAGARFMPTDPVVQHAWLFEWHPSMERVSGQNYKEYETLLAEQRIEAVKAIVDQKGWGGIEELVAVATNPYTVGSAIANIEDEKVDPAVLEWGSADPSRLEALQGYFFARSRALGSTWAEDEVRAHAEAWGPERTGLVLLSASDQAKAWTLAADLGPEVEASLWDNFRGFARGDEVWVAAGKLIERDRPFAAVQVIGTSASLKGESFDPELAYQVLDTAARATSPPRPEEASLLDYNIAQILAALDAAGFDEAKLADLEWVFVRILEREPEGLKHLYRRLALDPAFFSELIMLIFRARTDEAPADPDPELVRYAEHALNLLWHWNGPIPGATTGNDVDRESLTAWVTAVRTKLAAEGRKEIGDQRIGHILWYAPVGSDGVHPHEAVREVIEREASSDIDTGFQIEAVNSRGAVFRGKGGDQEREIAAQFRTRSEALSALSPRTSRIFANLAESYEADARREDERDKDDD
jgi:hypothetical protein